MSYNYETQKDKLFTEAGSRLFIAVRDKVKRLLSDAGAVRLQEATSSALTDSGVGACDGWTLLACIDRLVELGEIRELKTGGAAQHRVFVSTWQG